MADNVSFTASVATWNTAADKVTYSGDADQAVQLIREVGVTGSEGSKTVVELNGVAGTASSIVRTVQGITGMTPVVVGAPVGTPVFVRLSDGSNAIATLPVSLASVPSHAVTNAGTFAVQATLPTVSAHHRVCTASTNATSVKGSAGTLYGLYVLNNTDTFLYVKFHNTASTPTPGSGVTRAFGVQAGREQFIPIPLGGLTFSTGIGITVIGGTTGHEDTDTTAVAAGPTVEIFYA